MVKQKPTRMGQVIKEALRLGIAHTKLHFAMKYADEDIEQAREEYLEVERKFMATVRALDESEEALRTLLEDR